MRPSPFISFLVLSVVLGSTTADFLSKSLNRCAQAESWLNCLKLELLEYLDERLGSGTEPRNLNNLDEALVSRSFKYLRGFEYRAELPVVGARVTYKPGRSLADLDFEFNRDPVSSEQARGLLKKKLLLPILLLLKLKLKALMPIFVALIGLKALKALVLSKLAILIVVGFVALQFFKKGGMTPPMGMAMDPNPIYGAPPVSTSTTGYEPPSSWDSGYSRVWSPSNGIDSPNLAYSYYSGTGGSNSYSAPSSTSSSSSSSYSNSLSSSFGNYSGSPVYSRSQ